MKHFLTAACALVVCAGITTPIRAGSFGLLYAGRHCSDRGAVMIRPYNAFTPVICGDCGGGGGGCGAGGCGAGGCGAGGCGQQGYGDGSGNGCDPGYRMCGRLAPIGAPCGGAYTGALGYGPKDGYGIGAFGTQGCGCFHVFGRPSWGGCCSSGKCGNCSPDFVSGYINGYTGSPESYAAQGYGAEGYNTEGGSVEGYPTEGFNTEGYPTEGYNTDGYIPATPGQGEIMQPVPPMNPQLLPVPKTPATPPTTPTSTKTLATPVPRSATPPGFGAQPVSYYPGYTMPAQQMMPNTYVPAGWGYPRYMAYPGYYGYGMPMTYPAWGYPQGYRQGW